ncbi:MAG: HEAT repeat domain-containing protein [Acidobacteria bacterium]|uniref:HEAT repeat domain-containing protein n=1 Tax=Candidatus Polarisedimenticola svalbardensis TaxID=2886004 RepID=A0A8J6XQM9_9BACT|nr:HEAT repeat domain-containing protein [Candidatus Polarisedimenticola svalbardensis]
MLTCRTVARTLGICLLALVAAGQAAAGGRNYYEWTAVAPDVVIAKILGEEGRSPIAVAEQVLKGDLAPGQEFLVDLRTANKSRLSHRAKLRLLHGERYLLLLEHDPAGRRPWPLYSLVRGVDGAEELPREGEEALLDALRTFLVLHEIEDHDRLWERHSDLLESVNPIVLRTILDQYVKFSRGLPALIPSILPLAAHPAPDVRSGAVTLIGQIYRDREMGPEGDDSGVEGELIALARRDPAVDVRVAATIAVARLPGEGPVRILQQISREDPDQLVRYTAQKLLLEAQDNER